MITVKNKWFLFKITKLAATHYLLMINTIKMFPCGYSLHYSLTGVLVMGVCLSFISLNHQSKETAKARQQQTSKNVHRKIQNRHENINLMIEIYHK